MGVDQLGMSFWGDGCPHSEGIEGRNTAVRCCLIETAVSQSVSQSASTSTGQLHNVRGLLEEETVSIFGAAIRSIYQIVTLGVSHWR